MITRLFPEAIVNALGWTLLHSLWQIALFALLGALLLIFMRRFSAVARYRMIASIMGLFVLSSIFTFAQVYSPSGPTVLQDSNRITEDARQAREFQDEMANRDLETNDENQGSLLSDYRKMAAAYFSQHLPLTVSLWLLGVFVFVLKLLGQLAYVQRLKSYGVKQIPDSWNDLIREAESRMQVKKKVQYLGSRLADSPMTIGWWQPYILFPIELMSGLSESEIKSILAHELAHIKRNDYAMNIVQSLVGILYFYHPGSWWLSHRLSEEREHCCDDLALEMGTNPKHYAKTIIHLKEIQMNNFALAQNIQGPSSQTAFGHRTLRLLRSPLRSANYREGFLTAIVLVFGLFTAVQAASFADSQNIPFESQKQLDESDTSGDDLQSAQLFDDDASNEGKSGLPKDELDLLIDAIDEGNLKLVTYFLDQGVDVNGENDRGWTPLIAAASENQLEIAELIIERGAKVNYINSKGWTALIEAADEGSIEVVQLLITRGADVNLSVPGERRNALVTAASEGHLSIMKDLFDAGAKMNGEEGQIPMLHTAAEEGHLSIVRFLVERGAGVDEKDDLGRTALSYAAEEGNSSVIDYLLSKGADPDLKDSEGYSALIFAAEEDNAHTLETLLAKSSDKNNPMILFAALEEGNTRIVESLLESGHSVNTKFEGDQTPLMIAASEEEAELVNLLVEKGADVNAKDAEGRTALFFAAGEDDAATIRVLVEKGADLEAKTTQEFMNWGDDEGSLNRLVGMTALLAAIEEESPEVVQALVKAGADVNARSARGRWEYSDSLVRKLQKSDWDDLDLDEALDTNSGNLDQSLSEENWTPLMEAALSGRRSIVLILLDAGADKSLTTKSGMTAADVANNFGRSNLASILR